MPIPDFQSLMLPVLQCCSSGEISLSAATSRLADEFGLSPEERTSLIPSGRQTTFLNRISWARTYLDKAGLVERTGRGQFRATSRGLDFLARKPVFVDTKLLMQFEEFRKFRERTISLPASSSEKPRLKFEEEKQTPDEAMRTAWARIESSLAQDLLERVYAAPPDFF